MPELIIDHIGFCAFELMKCCQGHTWNKWSLIYNDGTAIKYRDNVCPYCSTTNMTVYGRTFSFPPKCIGET